ncbi:MAG: hypothetical protein M1817_004796 [Caeruleum heppii]|nr:MAG: hypothetical protein M1817_004796 [Caeruleum heppii]
MAQHLTYILTHVFLPPELPQKDDSDAIKSAALTAEVLTALTAFQAHFAEEEQAAWKPCIDMLATMLELRDHSGALIAKKLQQSLQEMENGDIVALHLRAQNAGLIIRRLEEQYSFESFELSPTNQATTTTKGRLRRCFPGPAMVIARDRCTDLTFLRPLTAMLAKLDVQTPDEALPTVIKARSQVTEPRDTVHPRFVTEMLTGILRAIGHPSDVSRIFKNTREDVLWKDTLDPWRRSPLWLFLRVALQTSLLDRKDEDQSHRSYKSFMLYFAGHLLEAALRAAMASDILFVLMAKISRRTLKLNPADGTAWLASVEKTMIAVDQELSGRWDVLEADSDPLAMQLPWKRWQRTSREDTALTITTLKQYLKQIAARATSPSGHHDFVPQSSVRIQQSSSAVPKLNISKVLGSAEVYLSLADLEAWVESFLGDWLRNNVDHPAACPTLADTIRTYTSAAASAYVNMPQDISVMLLTSMELWVALDQCAVSQCQLLRSYKPEFSPSLFEPLLLPKKSQEERLFRVEKYLEKRTDEASAAHPCIFRSVAHPNSFAVQYFDRSHAHQKLRHKIETEATEERSRRKVDLAEARKQYKIKMERHKHMDCDFVNRQRKGRQRSTHSEACNKCRLGNEAAAMKINVHEWPLPAKALAAKTTVFELDVPQVVSSWRNTTYSLLVDVLSVEAKAQSFPGGASRPPETYPLHCYAGLTAYIKSADGRVQFSSSSKPFIRSHYSQKKVSEAHEANICVNNGMNYAYHDSKHNKWTSAMLESSRGVRDKCTFQLPSGPYGRLQYAVDSTGHTSNSVLATQGDCSETLTLHEFYAFGTLRSGHRLQWRNITRELVARVLNFGSLEVHFLLTQTAWQAGPMTRSSACRESHIDLEEEDFGRSLLWALRDAMATVEGNWQGATALRTFVILATRLLSISTSDVVRQGCFEYLRKSRALSLRWTRELNQKLVEARTEEQVKELSVRTLEMALTCHGTFDVDQHRLQSLLELDEDVEMVIECSIVAHDRCPAVTDALPPSMETLLARRRRLSYHLEPLLRKRILKSPTALDRTLRRLWAGYRPGIPWSALAKPHDRWIVTETSSREVHSSLQVHYNLLDGSLLVNGLPLSRLPASYESHPTFRRLFGEGQKIFNVIPSTMSGMSFETRDEFLGHQIYFGMYESELIVRAKQQQHVFELIPIDKLNGDFPEAFVCDFAHWLDLATGFVEWRPLSEAWRRSGDNWQMRTDIKGEYFLTRGSSALIDVHSSTAGAVSSVLKPLERSTHLHITLDHDTGTLHVRLPRPKLDFLLREGASQLESKQFRGMAIDVDQSFGALTGLVNKLVLRSSTDSSRIVIIPFGDVHFQRRSHHVHVEIDISKPRITFQAYRLHAQLRQLVDDGSLKGKLFLCYLHALTAHCLADGLTGLTGTEQALRILRSASAHSFPRLDQAEIDLLGLLAGLTPRRQYYPRHLRVMHEVQWKALPPLSQHNSFYVEVQQTLKKVKAMIIVPEAASSRLDADPTMDPNLLARAAIRTATFRVHRYGAEDHTIKHDVDYLARDRNVDSVPEALVCETARTVDAWSVNLNCCSNLLAEMESWNERLTGGKANDTLRLGYDTGWLKSPSTFLPGKWCTLRTTLSRSVQATDRYSIMMFLSTLSYSQHETRELVQTLLAHATVSDLHALRPPDYPSFQLSDGYTPSRQTLIDLTARHARPYGQCPEVHLAWDDDETFHEYDLRRREQHQVAKETCVDAFVDALIPQWPRTELCAPQGTNFKTYISVEAAIEEARKWFRSWRGNALFQQYVSKTQAVLDSLVVEDHSVSPYNFSQPLHNYVPRQAYVTFDALVQAPAPSLPQAVHDSFDGWLTRKKDEDGESKKLEALILSLSTRSLGGFEQRYANDLRSSFHSLHDKVNVTLDGASGALKPLLDENVRLCKSHVDDVYKQICLSLNSATYPACRLARVARSWPRLSTVSLLQQLACGGADSIQGKWRRCLIGFGVAISRLQRAERLLASADKESELVNEISNAPHQGWSPETYPDWLLLEIENNISIRQVQAQIAEQMISPSSGANSVMQLNMGEGKSSVIVPIVAATLADRKRLVRVVVLKALSAQMFHVLLSKLGGLLGRRIFHLPITRSIPLNLDKARQIQNLCEECAQTGGILLMQPEHLLSFQLMGLERLLSGNSELGNTLIRTQRWLEDNSRDILDESDEILSVRFELIYSMGTQRAVEFSPDRWTLVENILGLVSRFAEEVSRLYPQGLELGLVTPGRFPRIRILQSEAADKLLELVTSELCQGGLPGVPVWRLPRQIRALLFRFITEMHMDEADMEPLQHHAFDVESTRRSLLLLKGLIAGGILTFALQQKRWRVNYGLHLSRTMLAVPYRAKDSPAPRAEFSHPDCTIVLTCLSYYYGGLSDDQLFTAFDKLLMSDHAQDEYERWVRDAPDLPTAFRQLTGINLSDTAQCSRTVFPPLRLAKGAIDYYLSLIVFPKEMKEFPSKLSSSGWDIARDKAHPTTGFSGTNDSRYVLPLSVAQCDIPQQRHINAAVLDCLLRPENSVEHLNRQSGNESLDAESLLQIVLTSAPPVRVILDVGAQVLELRNEEVARTWLSRIPAIEAQAAIFFDEHNELTVVSREGVVESLMTSPFAKQMDQCLVYLDEAHTRGTDLKLPTDYRAAVTLGPGLTKDQLVQACMRMRKLGKGQSVTFCGPAEVRRRILQCCGKMPEGRITMADVLAWSISETCISTQKCMPLWATQGLRYQRRHVAWSGSSGNEDGAFDMTAAKALLEPEAQTLEERYGSDQGRLEEHGLFSDGEEEKPLAMRAEQLEAIRTRCREFQLVSLSNAVLQEEQERELATENEQERQVERPAHLEPSKHSVHPDIRQLVKSGVLNRQSAAFQPAFGVLSRTSAREGLEPGVWPNELVVTADFARTVQATEEQLLDLFLRPVHWLLTVSRSGSIVVLSPFEAHELLPLIRQGKHVTLHVYSARYSQSMRTFEDLRFGAIPAVQPGWTAPAGVMALNLLAGQLYVRSHDEYVSLCRYLGLCSRAPPDGILVAGDGFVDVASRLALDPIMMQQCPFHISPVGLLRMIMAMRRKGQSFEMSHMGRILHGELLDETQFGS